MFLKSRTRVAALGLSLLELIVGTTVAVLLLGFFHNALTAASLNLGRQSQRAEVQKQATLALNGLARSLRQSATTGVSLSTGQKSKRYPTILAVHEVETLTPEGTLVWAPHLKVTYFDRQTRQLASTVWPPGPQLSAAMDPSRPLRVSAGDLETLASQPESSILLKGVTEFSVSHRLGTSASIAPPLTLGLTVEVQGKKGFRFQISRTTGMRND